MLHLSLKRLSSVSNAQKLVTIKHRPSSIGVSANKQTETTKWYIQSLLGAEMMDYSDISGCYALRPNSMAIWSQVQSFLNKELINISCKQSYFPLLISQDALQKESSHIDGFQPEVAWVTHTGNNELPRKLAIRPTSETAIYPHYSRWIRTESDLPLQLYQWCNVLRWEFENPIPFLRSREFLWQEGHSAWSSKEEAETETKKMLSLYNRVYRELFACPVIQGVKSDNEKFAGADWTGSIEAILPADGKSAQAATSHFLGQNFSEMFDISYTRNPPFGKQPSKNEKHYVWQTSWGFSTRSIGIMAMIHGDQKGLVFPPNVAPIQAIIIPVGIKASTPNTNQKINDFCQKILLELNKCQVRVNIDDSSSHSAGWKFSHWEMKGVPLRIEIGPSEIDKNSVLATCRHSGEKREIELESLGSSVKNILNQIQDDLYVAALENQRRIIKKCFSKTEILEAVAKGNIVVTPWCTKAECESDNLVDCDGIKTLVIPSDQSQYGQVVQSTCSICKREESLKWTLIGKSV